MVRLRENVYTHPQFDALDVVAQMLRGDEWR